MEPEQNVNAVRKAPWAWMWLAVICAWVMAGCTFVYVTPLPRSLEVAKFLEVVTVITFIAAAILAAWVIRRRRNIQGILGLLAVAMFPALVILHNIGALKEVQQRYYEYKWKSHAESTAREVANATEVIILTAEELAIESAKSNNFAVAGKYKGKVLEITGVLDRPPYAELLGSNPRVTLQGSGFRRVEFTFPTLDQFFDIQELTAGQKVTIRGKIDTVDNGPNLKLQFAHLIKKD